MGLPSFAIYRLIYAFIVLLKLQTNFVSSIIFWLEGAKPNALYFEL